MASRRGYSAFIIAASLLMLSGLSVLYLETDGSDGINEGFTWERNGDDVTVTGHGTLGYDSSWNGLKTLTLVPEGGTIDIESHAFEYCNSLTTVTFNGPVGSIENHVFSFSDSLTSVTVNGSVGSIGENAFEDCNSLTTVTIDGSVGSIGDHAFYDCDSLETVTIAGPITPPIGEDAFLSCNNLMMVNIACNDPLGITAQSSANGYIAYYADTVNKVHRYSATYDWVDDGSSCTVHIVCANTSDHDHDVTDSLITSTVKIPPTATEKGTTEYTVSGTYDGFSYSDTKDIQDIPAIGGDSGGKDSNILIYVAIAVIAALAIACAVILYIRSRR